MVRNIFILYFIITYLYLIVKVLEILKNRYIVAYFELIVGVM